MNRKCGQSVVTDDRKTFTNVLIVNCYIYETSVMHDYYIFFYVFGQTEYIISGYFCFFCL